MKNVDIELVVATVVLAVLAVVFVAGQRVVLGVNAEKLEALRQLDGQWVTLAVGPRASWTTREVERRWGNGRDHALQRRNSALHAW